MEEIQFQGSSLEDLALIFPPRKSISVLGTKPRMVQDFNALFLEETRELSGLTTDIDLIIPEGALLRLAKVANDLLSGDIDNEPLKYQIVLLSQTCLFSSVTWDNFKASLSMMLDSFQMLPQVAAILEEFTGSDQIRAYTKDRACAKAIFSQSLQQL